MGFTARQRMNEYPLPPSDNWRHKITLDMGTLRVDGAVRSVEMCREEVQIGCTTVSRSAIEKLAEWFDYHFPKLGKEGRVKIQ
jgi:hypothetical protein